MRVRVIVRAESSFPDFMTEHTLLFGMAQFSLTDWHREG